jgi:hypothetical protein
MPRKPRPPAPLTASEIEEANRTFVVEVERYGLIYRCDRCIHVVPASGLCSLKYPNDMLAKGPVRARGEDGWFVFCKDFELGD